MTHLTAENFKAEVLDSNIPVVVDFWATWCGPCMMFAPVLEEFEKEMDGKVKVCKVDVDEQPSLAMEYKVMSIPTVIIFKEGKAVKTSVGFIGKDELKELV